MDIAAKLRTIRARQQFQKHFENGDDLWNAWREQRVAPPARTRNGILIYHQRCDPLYFLINEIFFREAYTNGFFTPCAGQTVIDCGANIGIFTLFLCNQARGIKVHCFEPSSDTFRTLAANIRANDLQQFVFVHPRAIWKDNLEHQLNHFRSSGRRSFFEDSCLEKSGPNEIVSCIDLAQAVRLCGSETIDLVKIDAEGAELEIIESATFDTWAPIQRVVLEYHEHMRPGCRDRIVHALRNAGYGRLAVVHEGESDPIGIIKASR